MRRLSLALAGVLAASPLMADHPPDASPPARASAPDSPAAAGHSAHGDAFDHGPRQHARKVAGTGDVSFPVTSGHPEVRGWVEQGVGQLHGFWYFEAERSFREAAALDPGCAIAYWGMAQANTNNAKRAKAFIEQAHARRESASPRERLYIAALYNWHHAEGTQDAGKRKARAQKYLQDLEAIVLAHPDDLEAKAFLALQLWQGRSDVPIPSNVAVDALLKQVLAEKPLHPVHHFRIHLWDGDKAEQALDSAARCGQSAPGIAHMWHMPGHTYSKLHRYRDAAWQQEASARVDHAYMRRDFILPDQIHNYAHNNEWLTRDLLKLGRVNDALSLSRNMIDLPRHPSYNTVNGRGSAGYGRRNFYQTCSDYELWDELIAACQSQVLPPTDDPLERIKWERHLGRAYFRSGDTDAGRGHLDNLRARLDRLRKDADASATRAERAAIKTPDQAAKKARQSYQGRLTELESSVAELEGLDRLAAGDAPSAFASLGKAKGIDPALLADAQRQAGRADAAEKTLRDWVKRESHDVRPQAALVALLHQLGQAEAARTEFELLRVKAADADLDSPPLKRVAPVAEAAGLSGDWRKAVPLADDVGPRPPLDELGPFRWEPPSAPTATFRDGASRDHSLAEYRGKPVVVIFYLGAGCLHCVEQLQTFAPQRERFREAGIELLAISTESSGQLQQSIEAYTDGRFAIPLYSDESREVFRRFRAYDDFEGQPLHGTFLIDESGRVRWQDIGPEPFQNVQFLLAESQRLLDPTRTSLVTPAVEGAAAPASALAPEPLTSGQ